MRWHPLGKNFYWNLIEFLKIDEWSHIALTSRLKKAQKVFFNQVADGRIWVRENNGDIHGCLYISRDGVVLPIFDPKELNPSEKRMLHKLILIHRNRIFSIIGMSNPVRFVESFLNASPPDVKNYRKFTSDVIEKREENWKSPLVIRRAGLSDLDDLWSLEKAYQIEEVIREGYRLNESSARWLFAQTLQNQLVYYATLAEQPVAKAGTNARGWQCDQIGGVYVLPEYRNQGFGQLVMRELLRAIKRERHYACLFVEESNEPARHMYATLGFEDRGGFRISYWKES